MDLILSKVSVNVEKSLKYSGLKTRPGASSGPWIAFLLPTIIVVISCREVNLSETFRFSSVISSGLFGAAAIFISYLSTTTKNVRRFSALFYIPAFSTSLLLFIYLKEGILVSLACGIASCFSYFVGLPLLLEKFPLSFTFGEASVVMQALITFTITSLKNIFHMNNLQDLTDMDKITLILQVGLLGSGLIVLIVSCFPVFKRVPGFYLAVFAVALGFIIPTLHFLLRESPVLWILWLIFSKTERILIVLYWCCCCSLAVLAITSQVVKQTIASTVVRKNFHYLIVAVYIPGIVADCSFLYLSSGIVLAVFILLEMIRILSIQPLGETLQKSFETFADEKDQGPLALTPIYLLAGCSLPLWIHPSCCSDRPERYMHAMAGILTVGIGDTAASIGGSQFGRHKWPGSVKSIEGTVISVVLQYAVIMVFVFIGYIPASLSFLWRPFVVVIITSILEAKTDQVDNLVLPLVQLLLLL